MKTYRSLRSEKKYLALQARIGGKLRHVMRKKKGKEEFLWRLQRMSFRMVAGQSLEQFNRGL